MIDLNPLAEGGVNLQDLRFIHLFIVWMASRKDFYFSNEMQVLAAQNFKNASHFDLKTSRISGIQNEMEISAPIFQAAWEILEQLEDFARKYAPDYLADVEFQQRSFAILPIFVIHGLYGVNSATVMSKKDSS